MLAVIPVITEVFINCYGSPGEANVSCALGYQRELSCYLFVFAFDFFKVTVMPSTTMMEAKRRRRQPLFGPN